MRTTPIQIRATPEEKAWLKAAARQADLNLSEFIRREIGLGKFARADYQRLAKAPADRKPAAFQAADIKQHPDWEARVRKEAMRMPQRAAERVVRRQLEEEA